MEPIEQEQQSIIEEEKQQGHINIGYDFGRKYSNQVYQPQYKYASVSQIRSFQRASEMYNKQLLQKTPELLSQQLYVEPALIHFVSEKSHHYFKKQKKQEEAKQVLLTNEMGVHIKIPVSNIKRQNTLTIQVKNLKRKIPIQLYNIVVQKQQQLVRYKYIMTLNQINLCIKVLVKLNDEFKVWKQIDVPLTENRFVIGIHQYNNQQTDIKINNFQFHLVLKMPFHDQTNYFFKHQGRCTVEKIEFISKSQLKAPPVGQSNCSKECQLI